MTTDSHNAVNREGGALHCGTNCSRIVAGDDVSEGILEGCQSRRVGALGVEEDGGDGHTPAAEERPAPECVSPIIAGAHQEQDTIAGDGASMASELLQSVGVETVGGPLHELAFGQCLQERFFGSPNTICTVNTGHGSLLLGLVRSLWVCLSSWDGRPEKAQPQARKNHDTPEKGDNRRGYRRVDCDDCNASNPCC